MKTTITICLVCWLIVLLGLLVAQIRLAYYTRQLKNLEAELEATNKTKALIAKTLGINIKDVKPDFHYPS